MYIKGIRFLESEEWYKKESMRYHDAARMLTQKGLTPVKCSVCRGYIKRGKGYTNCIVVPYDGNYGVGYCVHFECDSTRYHIVEYWVDMEV